MMRDETFSGVAIMGGGPAGLAAAEALIDRGIRVCVLDAMPSFGRKFLMAGKSGLNITHSEDLETFLDRYRPADPRLIDAVRAFAAPSVRLWMEGLGIETFTGSSGRVFPTGHKASPLLRAWLRRLAEDGVDFRRRWRWRDFSEDGSHFVDTPDGPVRLTPDATLFAFGGASWPRLGSTGAWSTAFEAHGIALTPFRPSNCGFRINWSAHMTAHAGAPVKPVRLSAVDGSSSRGEFIITHNGIEGGGVYALAASLQQTATDGAPATLLLDLAPDLSEPQLAARLSRAMTGQSLTNVLRKAAGLDRVKRALLNEPYGGVPPRDPAALARAIKRTAIRLEGPAAIEGAISTAGGVAWSALDDNFMITAAPGNFCAGEMLDWDAPTGGYLLTACLSTGRAAGAGAARWLHG